MEGEASEAVQKTTVQTWKQRRAEYLLKAGRIEEIRAEGLEQYLGFEPGTLIDQRDEAQRLILAARRKIPHKQRRLNA